MKLYRGDSIPKSLTRIAREDRGRSFADHFCGNGLMSKFADGSSSTLLCGKKYLDMVMGHVGYAHEEPEQRFSYFSPFLSFSKDEATAFSFAERSRKKDLEECCIEDASHFVWELDVDLSKEVEVGRYEFSYDASSINCVELVHGQIRRGLEHEAATQEIHKLAMAIMNYAAMSHADADPLVHRAELVDVVMYVQNNNTTDCNTQLVNRTLVRASRSQEWLLYPTDPMVDGPGLSPRFTMNRHLRVHRCYRVRSG